MCNVGIQAALLAYAIEGIFPNNSIQVYNVSHIKNPFEH
ncbi:unnamed protein product [Haemonchus placei]|uniref:Uncharacterized protein n=1 Tax=Haemonchus placei TaxID=6290 RepID=A0A0N4W5X1_HAEPC|nr:unnamed protein product [Haemonchus placei]